MRVDFLSAASHLELHQVNSFTLYQFGEAILSLRQKTAQGQEDVKWAGGGGTFGCNLPIY